MNCSHMGDRLLPGLLKPQHCQNANKELNGVKSSTITVEQKLHMISSNLGAIMFSVLLVYVNSTTNVTEAHCCYGLCSNFQFNHTNAKLLNKLYKENVYRLVV